MQMRGGAVAVKVSIYIFLAAPSVSGVRAATRSRNEHAGKNTADKSDVCSSEVTAAPNPNPGDVTWADYRRGEEEMTRQKRQGRCRAGGAKTRTVPSSSRNLRLFGCCFEKKKLNYKD